MDETTTVEAKALRVGDIIVTPWGDDQRVEALTETHALLWSVTYEERVGWRWLRGSVEVRL